MRRLTILLLALCCAWSVAHAQRGSTTITVPVNTLPQCTATTGSCPNPTGGYFCTDSTDDSLWFCRSDKTWKKIPASAVNSGTTLPSTCTTGEIFQDTDATSGQQLYACESANTWVLQGGSGGSGDLVGPSSSTDNALARFDGTTGKLLSEPVSNPPTLSDTGDLTIPKSVTVSDGTTADWSITVDTDANDAVLLYDDSEGVWSKNYPVDLRPARSQMITKWEAINSPATWGTGDDPGIYLPGVIVPWRAGISSESRDGTDVYNLIGMTRGTGISGGTACPGSLASPFTGDSDENVGAGECEWATIGDNSFNHIGVLFDQDSNARTSGLDLIGKNIIDMAEVGNTAATYDNRFSQWMGSNHEFNEDKEYYLALASGPGQNLDAGSQQCLDHATTNLEYRLCFARSRLILESGENVVPIHLTEATLEGGRGDGVNVPEGIWNDKFILANEGSTNICDDPGFDTTGGVSYGTCTGPDPNPPPTDTPGPAGCVYSYSTTEDHGWAGTAGQSLRVEWDENDVGAGPTISKCDATVAANQWVHCRMFVKVTEDLSFSEIDMRLLLGGVERTYLYNGDNGTTNGLERKIPQLRAGEWHELRFDAQDSGSGVSTIGVLANKSGSGTDRQVEMFFDDIQCVLGDTTAANYNIDELAGVDAGVTPFFPAEGDGPHTLDPGLYLKDDMKAEIHDGDGYAHSVQVVSGSIPPMIAGRWYGPETGGNMMDTDQTDVGVPSISSTATTGNVHIYPFYVERRTSFDSARIRIGTGESGKTVQVGLYTWDYGGFGLAGSVGCGGSGSTLAHSWPATSITSSGAKSMDVSPYVSPYNLVEPGWYCAVLFTDATATATARSKRNNSTTGVSTTMLGSAAEGELDGESHWQGDATYSGSLPADLSGVTNLSITDGSFPAFYFRVKL